MSRADLVDTYTAKDIMVRDLVTGKPSDTIREAVTKMRERNVGSILIVDNDGKLAGILTERDLVRIIADNIPVDTAVENVMTKRLITGSPGEPLTSILCKMIQHNIRHVPITDAEGRPLGIISMRDLIRVEAVEQHLCRVD